MVLLEVVFLATELCIRVKLGHEQLFAANWQGQVRHPSHVVMVCCFSLIIYLRWLLMHGVIARGCEPSPILIRCWCHVPFDIRPFEIARAFDQVARMQIRYVRYSSRYFSRRVPTFILWPLIVLPAQWMIIIWWICLLLISPCAGSHRSAEGGERLPQ